MAFAFYSYRPQTGHEHLNLSALTSIAGEQCMQYMCQGSYFTDITLGVKNINTNTTNYGMRYAFADCPNLSAVNFPDLSVIQNTNTNYIFQYAFQNDKKLSSVTFPKLTRIGTTTINTGYTFNYAFFNCPNLTSINFPELTSVLTGCQGTFNTMLWSNVDNAATNYKVCEVHMPKLTTWRQSTNTAQSF